jgi:hypothetical protein
VPNAPRWTRSQSRPREIEFDSNFADGHGVPAEDQENPEGYINPRPEDKAQPEEDAGGFEEKQDIEKICALGGFIRERLEQEFIQNQAASSGSLELRTHLDSVIDKRRRRRNAETEREARVAASSSQPSPSEAWLDNPSKVFKLLEVGKPPEPEAPGGFEEEEVDYNSDTANNEPPECTEEEATSAVAGNQEDSSVVVDNPEAEGEAPASEADTEPGDSFPQELAPAASGHVKLIAIDLHGTIDDGKKWSGGVPVAHIEALRSLINFGFIIWICSFIGLHGENSQYLRDQAERTRKYLAGRLGLDTWQPKEPTAGYLFLCIVDRKFYDSSKARSNPRHLNGKSECCRFYNTRILIDDRADICKEALTGGILPYLILPPWSERRRNDALVLRDYLVNLPDFAYAGYSHEGNNSIVEAIEQIIEEADSRVLHHKCDIVFHHRRW